MFWFESSTAPLAFQKVMHMVLGGLGFQNVLVYLDDCLIHTSTLEDHLKSLENVLQCFKHAGLDQTNVTSLWKV